MSIDHKFRSVTEAEFIERVKAYPRQLSKDVNQIYDPPLVTYNDFSDGMVWPESIVALYSAPYVPGNRAEDHRVLIEVPK